MLEPPEAFGTRLRDLRVRRGVSQVDLAGEELSPSYISRLEAGQRAPTDAVVRLLARRLDCRPEDLLFGEGAITPGDVELELRHAELALRTGAVGEAVERFERLASLSAHAHLDALRDSVELGYALALEADGDHEAALARYLRVSAGDPVSALVHRATVGACRCYLAHGDLAQTLQTGEPLYRWLAANEALGTDAGIELTTVLAGAYQERGDLATARRLATEALAQAEPLGDATALARTYQAVSLAAHEHGATAEALRLAERGLAALAGDDAADPSGLEIAYGGLLLHDDPPRTDEAIRVLTAARARLTAPHRRTALAACLTELARAQLLAGDAGLAADTALAAQDAGGDTPLPEAVRTLLVRAAALSTAGSAEVAAVLEVALRRLSAGGPTRGWARAWREYGDLLVTLGRVGDAIAAYDEALRRTGLLPAAVRPRDHGTGSGGGRDSQSPDDRHLRQRKG